MCVQQCVVTRRFVIETKTVAMGPDLANSTIAAAAVVKRIRRRANVVRRGERCAYSRPQRVTRKHMLDIGKKQFLVLLLVIQSERGQLHDDVIVGALLEQRLHGCIHVPTVIENVCERRARQQAAMRTRVHAADRVVVGVEKVVILLVKVHMVFHLRLQDEVLEEPGDVRKVPLGGADIGHRLHHRVFRLQFADECKRCRSNLSVTIGQHGCLGGVSGRHSLM